MSSASHPTTFCTTAGVAMFWISPGTWGVGCYLTCFSHILSRHSGSKLLCIAVSVTSLQHIPILHPPVFILQISIAVCWSWTLTLLFTKIYHWSSVLVLAFEKPKSQTIISTWFLSFLNPGMISDQVIELSPYQMKCTILVMWARWVIKTLLISEYSL